ncbi:hypothetical protein DFA_11144 [Cavenderia fasciculata]|uniref:Uncharacterized protein n=1 Tax=Cavenderia fasciculata TaxID=261658 RepID=F4QF24_CACFS|nr:uncharacterized protein DFA_11144 [Cavenderia fasciculata]EGG13383.1 hypothetical protein DFA_11144 [Cavenderia fasciculata]|eukprot:XP_004350087.1 hypothetical protein DFA_11144 [Cavenderia fasciculata]
MSTTKANAAAATTTTTTYHYERDEHVVEAYAYFTGVPTEDYQYWVDATQIAMGPRAPLVLNKTKPKFNHQLLEHQAAKTKLLVSHLTGDSPKQYHQNHFKKADPPKAPHIDTIINGGRFQSINKAMLRATDTLHDVTEQMGEEVKGIQVTRDQKGKITEFVFFGEGTRPKSLRMRNTSTWKNKK